MRPVFYYVNNANEHYVLKQTLFQKTNIVEIDGEKKEATVSSATKLKILQQNRIFSFLNIKLKF